jgi:intracellular multiplication protein IcmV
MGFFRTTGKVMGLMFNFRADKWIGYKNLKNTTSSLFNTGKEVFLMQNANIRESFTDSIQRLHITEEDLLKKQKECYWFMLFYFLLTIMVGLYGMYLAFNGQLLSFITSVAITCLCLSNYFRYSFWLFQMKHKKLGCSFKEWLNGEIIVKHE